jgi:hypothetical protein
MVDCWLDAGERPLVSAPCVDSPPVRRSAARTPPRPSPRAPRTAEPCPAPRAAATRASSASNAVSASSAWSCPTRPGVRPRSRGRMPCPPSGGPPGRISPDGDARGHLPARRATVPSVFEYAAGAYRSVPACAAEHGSRTHGTHADAPRPRWSWWWRQDAKPDPDTFTALVAGVCPVSVSRDMAHDLDQNPRGRSVTDQLDGVGGGDGGIDPPDAATGHRDGQLCREGSSPGVRKSPPIRIDRLP